MHAVIFEFWPAEGRLDDYFDNVATLKRLFLPRLNH